MEHAMAKQKKTTTKVTGGTKPAKEKPQTVAAGTTKLAQLEALLRRPEGATLTQISASIGWQAHSVRGAMSGTLKKRGLIIISERKEEEDRIYRVAA
jgi:hypothetical protein